MENLQTSNSDKDLFKLKADSITGLVQSLNYEVYSDVALETLILLTNHIRVIPSEEINNFRIVKYTEAWFIFRKLRDAYSERRVKEEMESLLEQYEHYEVLTEF